MKKTKRAFSFLLVLIMVIGLFPVAAFAAEASGTCGGEGDGKNLTWKLTADGQLTISGKGKMKDFYGSSYVPWRAVKRSITSVVVEEGVTSLGDYAFDYLENLTSVTIADSVTSAGVSVFNNCLTLPAVTLPDGITSIGENFFYSCYELAYVKLPKNLKYIGERAFNGCGELQSVTIPEGVTVLEEDSFWGCGKLRSVTFPKGMTSIGVCAFDQCWELTDVTLPEALTTIGGSAFRHCTSLTDIIIPSTVTNVAPQAFYRCKSLSAVYFENGAPTVRAASDATNQSFPTEAVLYHAPGAAGWTDSSAYDETTNTWNGYKLGTWDPDLLVISMKSPETVEINGGGTARLWFQLCNALRKPQAGYHVEFESADGACSGSAVTDGNGMFGICIYGVWEEKDLQLQFTVDEHDGKLIGAAQTATVRAKPFSFEQSWKGALGAKLEVSAGPGAGFAVGAAEAEASLIKAAASGAANGQLEVSNSYDDGERTLELAYTYDLSMGAKLKTGVEGTVLDTVKMDVIGASAGATQSVQREVGLKVNGYDPENGAHLLNVGGFLFRASVIGQNSVLLSAILDWLDVGDDNQVGHLNKLAFEAGASVGKVEIEEMNEDFALAGIDGELALSYGTRHDFTDNTEEQTVEFMMDWDGGFLKDYVPWMSGNAWGGGNSNALKITGTFAEGDNPVSLSYTMKKEEKQDAFWMQSMTETSETISFAEEEMWEMAAADRAVGDFVSRKNPILSPLQMLQSVYVAAEGNYTGITKHEVAEKRGLDLEIPFGAELIVGGEVELSGSFFEEFSYEDQTGIYVNNQTYTTSESGVWEGELESVKVTLVDLLSEAIHAISNAISHWVNSVFGSIQEGVENGFAKVKGTVKQWCVSIDAVFDAPDAEAVRSYAVAAISLASAPDSEAAVAVTLGEPYYVAIYTDESRTELVSEEELAAEPPVITLAYTEEMLLGAGAPLDAELRIYRFDAERNLYVCQESTQDPEAMTVSAAVTKHGEYILAVDTASPLISDFHLSDGTAMPEMTVLISDLSGIGAFSFCIDDGEELVNQQSFEDYYDFTTGRFCYPFSEPLSDGEHTAYFRAADQLGNANKEPFAFTFTVDAQAPVIRQLSVPQSVTAENFTVTAAVEENEQLSGVLVSVKTASGQGRSIPMTLVDGLWQTDLLTLQGESAVTVTVVATDFAGNRTESEAYEVEIGLADEQTGLSVQERVGDDGTVTVTVSNRDAQSVSGWLITAAYDGNGRMLGMANAYVGLSAQESRAYVMDLKVDSFHELKSFLLDLSGGYIPLL